MPGNHDFHVLQIARNELSRKSMEDDSLDYTYNHTLLFDDYIENVSPLKELFQVILFFFKFNPDIVNLTGYATNISTLPVFFLSKLLGKKVILSNESTLADSDLGGWKGKLKKWLVKGCSGYVVFGQSSERFLKKLGAGDSKIWIRNAAVVDNQTIRTVYESCKGKNIFPEIKTAKNFIYVGRIAQEKNVALIIEAFQNLNKSSWGLIIVGNGNQDEEIHNLITRKPENIYKFDATSWKEIPKFFTQSDCLILASKSEPWGLVVNEAMVCGLAVIVSDAVGCKDDLVKDNGLIVETGSLSALQSAMEAISKNDDLDKMKARSVQLIQIFSLASVAKDYVQKISSLA